MGPGLRRDDMLWAVATPFAVPSHSAGVDAMARSQAGYACQQCGEIHAKWSGRCDGCGAWNSLIEEAPRETMLTVNWMLDEPTDIETALGFDILEHILIGTAAAPLYKALIDSGLGEALAGNGLDDSLRQPMFSIGLKGIDVGDADKVERLILDTFATLAAKGIDAGTLEAALNTVEFHLRENNTGAFPRGIVFMLRSLRSWLHGRDPLSPLAFAAPLAAIKAKVAAGEPYFENLMRRQLVDSRHRTVMILKPDQNLAEREAKEEEARLARVRAGMNGKDVAAAVEAGSDEGVTNVLPAGPASTASCSALPWRYCGQLRNHSVQPLSQVPPFGLPTMVMGSPGTARL